MAETNKKNKKDKKDEKTIWLFRLLVLLINNHYCK